MCGRFTLKTPSADIASLFDLTDIPTLAPRFNIAPSQPVACVVESAVSRQRSIQMFRWGLIPPWAPDPSFGNRAVNARSESAADKPSFRQAIRERRCLIVTDGFFEWEALGNTKQPFYISMKDHRVFAFAGLWETWKRAGEQIESCAILTTAANGLMQQLHDRMPVIVPPKDFSLWLDPTRKEPAEIEPLLVPYSAEEMMFIPVSTKVNGVKYDGPDLIEPSNELRQQSLF